MALEQLGRYEIIRELGHGAMGIVYKARDPLIDRIVAIKTIFLDLSATESAEFEQRFYREAKSAGRLNHANIVTIHDVGKSNAVAYIAMEFLDGQSLREILDSGVVLPSEQIVDIVAQVADGLAFAHEKGVVHRDIKPSNIMVSDSGSVKITDFGIALLPTGSRTMAGNVFGSPKYMSPEQVMGQAVNGRADIFSLGTVLYEMLTGFPPFFGGDLNAVIDQVIHQTPPAPSRRNKGVAPVFDHIVAKAMAKKPDDRYSTAQAMATDLRNFRDFAVWRPAGDVAVLRDPAAAAALSDPVSSPPPIAPVDAVSRQRRNVIVYGVPVALVAVVGGWAMLSKRAPDRAQPVAANGIDSSTVDMPAGANPPTTELVRPEQERVERMAASQPAAAPIPAAAVADQAPAATKPMARLTLAVTPWGEVFVDGKRKGITPPMAEIQLAPGKHAIEIRNTTFQPYRRTVELGAGGRLKIKHKFQ